LTKEYRVETKHQSPAASLPSFDLALRQSHWLKPARTRLLRAANIYRASRVVDLACGWGQNAAELVERCEAQVIGIDSQLAAIEGANRWQDQIASGRLSFLQADARALPLEDGSQDLILIQCGLLWMQQPEKVLRECHRILNSRASLVMIEPDYGGLMEYPETIEARPLWTEALRSSGADPLIGRKLPALCDAAGFETHVYFLDRYEPPQEEYLQFLDELPLSDVQRETLNGIRDTVRRLTPGRLVVHLPFWMAVAKRL
jgi:ubiquinone/menaquinone biosynthesis C-methylase UbiE